MDSRKNSILQSIIEEFIDSASPVGSKILAEFLGFSSATIRAEMAELEEEGLITQPHTSAGRIPTEKGYRHYVNSLSNEDFSLDAKKIKGFAEKRGIDKTLKLISVNAGGNTAFCVTPSMIKYHGLADTLAKKDFDNKEKTIRFAKLLDNMPDFIQSLEFDNLAHAKTFIGEENTYKFAKDFSIVAVCFPFGSEPCVLGVIGPLRMPYQKIVPYLEQIAQIFKDYKMLG